MLQDNKLSFKPPVEERLRLAIGALAQVWRLGGVFKGISGTAMRQIYLGCVLQSWNTAW